MPLSWNEIRDRATAFSHEWKHTESEDADAKSILDGFFEVFGVQRRKVASFERKVKKLDGRDGYIDLLWKGTLLVEQTSRGKDLERAYRQAKDYLPHLGDDDWPRFILVCDFWHFELHDLDGDKVHRFTLRELPKKTHLFHFIAGYRKQQINHCLNREEFLQKSELATRVKPELLFQSRTSNCFPLRQKNLVKQFTD